MPHAIFLADEKKDTGKLFRSACPKRSMSTLASKFSRGAERSSNLDRAYLIAVLETPRTLHLACLVVGCKACVASSTNACSFVVASLLNALASRCTSVTQVLHSLAHCNKHLNDCALLGSFWDTCFVFMRVA